MTHSSAIRSVDRGRKPWLGEVFILLVMIAAAVIGILPITVPPARAASPDGYQVERALRDLRVIAAQPRVPGMAGIDKARGYLQAELEKLGLEVEVTDVELVNPTPAMHAVTAVRAHNLLARLKGTNSSGAVLVAGHLDSAPTAQGASDCGGCAVSVLETARVLASTTLRNDVIFLIEDGEETTRSGSRSFVWRHPWAKDVRVAINLEAMGTNGASTLYVTGPQNGWVMNEALQAMPAPVAYSFINDLVWLTGTGGSDLDQYLETAPVGVGLLYTGNVPAYHTMKDSVESLDPATLQHQGENALALTRHFASLALDGELRAPDMIYYNLLSYWVLRYPGWAGIALAVLAALGFIVVLVSGLRRGSFGWRGLLTGVGVFLPVVLITTIVCGLLWYAIRLVDPRLQVYMVGVTYDREWYTLAFALLSTGLVLLAYRLFRRASWAELGAGALAWWVLFALLTAVARPGVSPFFTLPALFALAPLALCVFVRGGGSRLAQLLVRSATGFGVVLIAAPVINFVGIFSGRGEMLMAFPLIAMLPALFTAPAAALLLPVEAPFANRRWVSPLALTAVAGLILAGVALTAAFTPARPKPNMIAYVQNAEESYWVTLGLNVGGSRAGLLDEWTRQFLGDQPDASTFSASGAFSTNWQSPAYRAAAPRADLPDMDVTVLEDAVGADGLRHLRLHLVSPLHAPISVIRMKSERQILGAQLWGQPVDAVVSANSPLSELLLAWHAADEKGLDLDLTLQGKGALTLNIGEHVYSLPQLPGMTIQPRPDWMMPSPTFITDSSLLQQEVVLP